MLKRGVQCDPFFFVHMYSLGIRNKRKFSLTLVYMSKIGPILILRIVIYLKKLVKVKRIRSCVE